MPYIITHCHTLPCAAFRQRFKMLPLELLKSGLTCPGFGTLSGSGGHPFRLRLRLRVNWDLQSSDMPGAGTEMNVTVGFGDYLKMMNVSYVCHMCVLLHVYMTITYIYIHIYITKNSYYMLLHVYIYSYICYFWICKQCPFQVGKPRYNTICFLSASITLDVQTQCQVLQFANHNLQVLVMFYLICLHICKIIFSNTIFEIYLQIPCFYLICIHIITWCFSYPLR